jgi:membrane-associated phospholipid phosphatase
MTNELSSWASASLLRGVLSRTRLGWRETQRGSFPKLLVGMIVSWLVAAGVIYLLTRYAKSVNDAWLRAWDLKHVLLARDGEGWASLVPITFTDAIIFESPSNIFILLPVTLLAAGWALWKHRPVLALAFVLNYGAARFLIWLGWWTWDRQRPQVVADGAAALKAHAFPSGHTLLTFTTYGLLAVLWMRMSRSWIERVLVGLLFGCFAFVIAYARVRLGAHWPSDCIAGAIGGTVWLTGVALSLAWAGSLPRARG